MTRSHRFRSTTLPRVALVAAAVLVMGLSAPPAAAQTATQVDSTADRVRAHDGRAARTAPTGVLTRAVDAWKRAEAERAAAEAARARVEQQRADEAARVKAEQVERYLTAAAAHEAEVAAQQVEAERAAAERAATRRSSGSLSGGFAALRNCESGGDYGAVSSSGTYRGAYQFSRTTWNSVAASSFPHLVGVDPAAAAPGDQDAMAQALYQRSGAGQWPHCGRHL